MTLISRTYRIRSDLVEKLAQRVAELYPVVKTQTQAVELALTDWLNKTEQKEN